MWIKWFPWKFLIRDAARKHGFLDPIKLLVQLENFAQPSEVAAPLELVRSGVVLHARGLINSLAIQHNLDWVWPYWVQCQYDPLNKAFIPRAFSLTQINLTHRNWTAVGIPDCTEFPLVDPRGLVTPFYDSWSIDAWVIPEEGEPLIPSRPAKSSQTMGMGNDLFVETLSSVDGSGLKVKVWVKALDEGATCQIEIVGTSRAKARLVVSLRPYNPEGVSFINAISLHNDAIGWTVNGKDSIYLDKPPDQWSFSNYLRGDVYSILSLDMKEKEIACKVGMASSAAVYFLEPGRSQAVTVSIPLAECKHTGPTWTKSLEGVCTLQIPDKHFQFLYEAAIHTMVLHSPKEVYPGPFIYRRFWFRDAAFILNALLAVGLKARVRRALDCFRSRQSPQGYFLSQEGEWDSNGEALWIMQQYCAMTGQAPPIEWKNSILKAGRWITRKRLSMDLKEPHAGLLPSGFSAEHLGPNDFYYWDDFWGVAGLDAATRLARAYAEDKDAALFEGQSKELSGSIDQSLKTVEVRMKRPAIPASPYRRLDTGAIGSVVASYPLGVLKAKDPRVLDTLDFLMKNCIVHGGFFHDMTHSGINPYLTLHLAQALLRAGDRRYFALMQAVAGLATSTGQWPESVHPQTGGGCMGDGQHVWAAAEWVLMIRNCFVREEEGRLILCSGIPKAWIDQGQTMSFGPAPTLFGDIHLRIIPKGKTVCIEWQGQWFSEEPLIDIQLPGYGKAGVLPHTNSIELDEEKAQ